MSKKIFRSVMLVAMAVLVACVLVILGVLYTYFMNIERSQLQMELAMAAAAVEDTGEEYLETVAKDSHRLTLIDTDGTVLYDTQEDASTLENHADREEVQEAFAQGSGESIRFSTTLLQRTQYYATRLSDGTVLRVAMTQATTFRLLLTFIEPIILVIILAAILAFFLSKRVSKRVVLPLNQLDLDHPLDNDAYEELSPLLTRINRLHHQIDAQMRELDQKREELETVTDGMQEGLVFLNQEGIILSINAAAQAIFRTDESCIGKDFLTVERRRAVTTCIQTALEQGHGETSVEQNGREYLFRCSAILEDGTVRGLVVLVVDNTDRAFAERNRREFTANVSHELKTPLQSIIGSAELLENGMVKQEDVPAFIHTISQESSRLVALVNDIIRLSQLDEGVTLPWEDVDLMELARETVSELQDEAGQKQVTLSVQGEPVGLQGVRQLLSEVMFNLCDNAIKYNKPQGSVTLTLEEEGDQAVFRVQDTGMGIPEEHQERIFERFYRVDKSHSKATGGTGLGLSIVKHAVQYHGGTIHLESQVGAGTTITVTLPKAQGQT